MYDATGLVSLALFPKKRSIFLKQSNSEISTCIYLNYNNTSLYTLAIIYKCKNIFTKMLKDVGMEVPKSIETRSKFSMHADKGRG